MTSILAAILLGLAVALAVVCACGMAIMRTPLQRLQFSAPVVFFSAGFIAVAVWLEETSAEARIKVLIAGAVLFVMNSILTHATGRAVFIRREGQWPLRPDAHIPIVGSESAAKVQGKAS